MANGKLLWKHVCPTTSRHTINLWSGWYSYVVPQSIHGQPWIWGSLMATQPHPIYGDVNFGDMFNRGFNFLSDNVIDPFAEAIRQSKQDGRAYSQAQQTLAVCHQINQLLSQPTVNPHPQVQAPVLSNITGLHQCPENLPVPYRDMGHVEQF